MGHIPVRDRYTLIESELENRSELADAVREGLTQPIKSLPCRFLYNDEGSQLFEQICELPEYYLTRAEREVLTNRAGEIAALFPEPTTLAELGSGSSSKTRLLIDAFLERRSTLLYVPVDISRGILEESALELLAAYEALEVLAIAGEYTQGLRRLRHQGDHRKLIVWLGSNVGNLEREAAAQFLQDVREVMSPADRMLVGIDLRKEAAVLEPAYDDAQGVTARFSLNLLQRINDELGGKFELESFVHRAVYEEGPGRVKIDLVSQRDQTVDISYLDLQVHFARGEGIHTESAYKYSRAEIDALAASAGLRVDHQWFDAAKRFSLLLFAPGPAG